MAWVWPRQRDYYGYHWGWPAYGRSSWGDYRGSRRTPRRYRGYGTVTKDIDPKPTDVQAWPRTRQQQQQQQPNSSTSSATPVPDHAKLAQTRRAIRELTRLGDQAEVVATLELKEKEILQGITESKPAYVKLKELEKKLEKLTVDVQQAQRRKEQAAQRAIQADEKYLQTQQDYYQATNDLKDLKASLSETTDLTMGTTEPGEQYRLNCETIQQFHRIANELGVDATTTVSHVVEATKRRVHRDTGAVVVSPPGLMSRSASEVTDTPSVKRHKAERPAPPTAGAGAGTQ